MPSRTGPTAVSLPLFVTAQSWRVGTAGTDCTGGDAGSRAALPAAPGDGSSRSRTPNRSVAGVQEIYGLSARSTLGR